MGEDFGGCHPISHQPIRIGTLILFVIVVEYVLWAPEPARDTTLGAAYSNALRCRLRWCHVVEKKWALPKGGVS